MNKLRILATTDLHGLFHSGQHTPRSDVNTIAAVREFVASVRSAVGSDNMIMLDAGDFMGGGLPSYWSNHLAPSQPHIAAAIANSVQYDVMAPGNHDLDAPPEAWARYVSELKATLTSANLNGIAGVKPYAIIRRAGLTVAVVGLATAETEPAIHPGATVTTLSEAAEKVVGEINCRHNPDLIIGLFHAGPQESAAVVEMVSGFDLVVCGHVHTNRGISFAAGVPIINPGPYACRIADITVETGRKSPRMEINIRRLHTNNGAPMPSVIVEAGARPLTQRQGGIAEAVHAAQHSAFPTALSVTECSSASSAPATLAESFASLPYDDYPMLIEPSPAERSLIMATGSLSLSGPADAPMVMTSYLARRLGIDGHTRQIAPHPLRKYLS